MSAILTLESVSEYCLNQKAESLPGPDEAVISSNRGYRFPGVVFSDRPDIGTNLASFPLAAVISNERSSIRV